MTTPSSKRHEEVYLLKNGALYSLTEQNDDQRLVRRSDGPYTISEIMGRDERFQLVLDDSYFFYVAVGKLSVSRKKVRNVIENYLQSEFPMDLFSGFAMEENKGFYTALVFRSDLGQLIASETAFFRKARKISAPFCEVAARYPTFLFTDGNKVYQKKEETLETLSDRPEGTLQASDMWGELLPLKCDVHLPGIQKSREALKGYQALVIVTAACYLLFLASGIVGVMSASRSAGLYDRQLQAYYQQAGVADSADPYGMLISKAQRSVLAPFRVLDVVKNLGDAIPSDVQMESFSINERTVRIDGFTKDFAEMEKLKTTLESHLKKSITVEDSRQAGDQIKFVIRYEP